MTKRLLIPTLCLTLVTLVIPATGERSATLASDVMVGRVHEEFQPEDGKTFILVIGNDARHGNRDTALADAIHIVGLDADTMRGGILNFPRDSWVSIPGYGSAKINEALWAGGPLALARTLENLTQIRIDYWVMVGFEGFSGIISDLDGVKMTIPFDLYDPYGSGVNLEAGRQHLKHWEVLALARTRHNFPNGDIDRTTNQAKILLALLSKFRAQVADDPAALMRWMAVTRRHARLDISAGELFRLGIVASQVSPRRVGNVTVPVSLGWVGAASVAFISPSAESIYRRFRETASL